MSTDEAIKELEEDKALYMPEEWVESIDRDTPDGRLITALDKGIEALRQVEKVNRRLDKQGIDLTMTRESMIGDMDSCTWGEIKETVW